MEKNRVCMAARTRWLLKSGYASAARLWLKLGGPVRQHRRRIVRERRCLSLLGLHPFSFPRDMSSPA